MTRKMTWLAINLSLILSMLVSSAMANDLFVPDHYLSYDMEVFHYAPEKVVLRDQFIDPTKFIVSKPIKLLNPTVKRHNNEVYPINNPKLHYTAYQVDPVKEIKIDQRVLVNNQFGTFVFDSFRPSRLLVPTAKKVLGPHRDNEEEIAAEADHYLCYDILEQEIDAGFGFLKDQFRSREFHKLVAKRLCNPVAKRHGKADFPIVNDSPLNHLMCFEMDSQEILRLVALKDQFGTKIALVYRDDEICVPSLKIEIPLECGLDAAGQCSGACPHGLECMREADSCECSPPIVECGFDDEGLCRGECPEGFECQEDADFCECRPQIRECGFDAAGQCFGECPEGLECRPDADQTCECRPPFVECGFDTDGQCSGKCPERLECVVDDTNQTCECRPPVMECGFDDAGQCFGECPAGLECLINDADQSCACRDSIMECGFDAAGECGGVCPDDLTCVQDPINQQCFCRSLDFGCGLNDEGECGGACPNLLESCRFSAGACLCVIP